MPASSLIRRYGTNFDAGRYEREGRQHLVADSHKRAIISEIAKLEEAEPSKTDSERYAVWQERIELLRKQIPKPDLRAPLLAMTTTAAAYAFDHLEAAPFDYVVFDEASQISLPYACALGTLGRRLIFAGDPKQLAPIVVSKHPTAQNILSRSAFEYMRPDNRAQLDEQDRMVPEICGLVADLFYDGSLYVVEASERNAVWQAERNAPRVPSLGRARPHVEPCLTNGEFSTKNGVRGVFRFESAMRAVEIASECARTQSGTIAIITPFRKQRQIIEKRLRTEGLKNVTVSTVHSVQGWPESTKRWQDAILRSQQKGIIRTHGASVHGLPALRRMPGTHWLDVGLIRINHSGARMDGPTYEDTNHPDNISEVVGHIQQLKKEGLGVIGMKLCGGGQFEKNHDDRVKAMRFAFQNAGVDCATVGFKNTLEIDEAITNMNRALA